MHEGYAFLTELRSPTRKGRPGSGSHDATADVRRDDARRTRSTGPSQPIGKPVPEVPFSVPLPREEILRLKREYLCADIKPLPKIPLIGNDTHITDSLNNLMNILTMPCQNIGATLDSPYWLSGWEHSLHDAIRLNMGKLISSETRSITEHTFPNMRQIIADDSFGPKNFQLLLPEMNLDYSSNVSSPNLAETDPHFPY